MGARGRAGRGASQDVAAILIGALVLLLVVAVAGIALYPRMERSLTGPPSATSSVVNDGAAQVGARRAEYTRLATATLNRLGAAVMRKDRSAYLAQFDARAAQVRTAEAQQFSNLMKVPFRSYTYSVVQLTVPDAEPSASRPVTARVNLSYRLTADPALTNRSFDMSFVPAITPAGPAVTAGSRPVGSRWVVTKVVRAADTPTDPWNHGRVDVVSTPRALVLGVGSATSLRSYARLVSRGAARIDRIWGSRWPRQSVLVVPGSQQQLADMLGQQDQQGLDQIAAVTTGVAVNPAGSTAGQAARVIVNPRAMDRLGALGHQVIITHEMTHLATRHTTTATPPMWLAEGFADYVAYTGTGLGAKAITANTVPRQKVPSLTGLPDDDDFNPRATSVDSAYAQSWLAVDLISRQWSRKALLAFYRANAAPSGAAANLSTEAREGKAFREVLGTTEAQFATEWRKYFGTVVS